MITRMASVAPQVYFLYLRNLRNVTRVPSALIAPLLIPTFFFIVNGYAFTEVVRLPGFTTDSYLAWQVAIAIMMTVSVTSVGSGLGIVMDINSGYLDKLLLTPVHRPAILLSRLLTEATRVTIQMALIVLIALGLGVRPEAGAPGILLMILLGILWALVYAPISISIALRTRNAEATNASFMLMFPLVFLTTGLMPKEFYPEWLKIVVALNPVNYVLEGVRAPVIAGFQWSTIGWAFLSIAIVGSITLPFGYLSFQRVTR